MADDDAVVDLRNRVGGPRHERRERPLVFAGRRQSRAEGALETEGAQLSRADELQPLAVGERDAECPAPQSYEFWKGLKAFGVPTELVVYADEGHHYRDAAHVLDAIEREVAWFDRYLGSPRQSPAR